MLRQHFPVGHVVGHLAQTIHVVGKANQPALAPALGQHLEGVAHHGRARHLAESADMRQPGGTVAGLENHGLVGAILERSQPLDDPPRLLERPGPRLGRRAPQGCIDARCHGWHSCPPLGGFLVATRQRARPYGQPVWASIGADCRRRRPAVTALQGSINAVCGRRQSGYFARSTAATCSEPIPCASAYISSCSTSATLWIICSRLFSPPSRRWPSTASGASATLIF